MPSPTLTTYAHTFTLHHKVNGHWFVHHSWLEANSLGWLRSTRSFTRRIDAQRYIDNSREVINHNLRLQPSPMIRDLQVVLANDPYALLG